MLFVQETNWIGKTFDQSEAKDGIEDRQNTFFTLNTES